MKDNTIVIMIAVAALVLLIGYATIPATEEEIVKADDAFTVLEQLEKNYVGLVERLGLDTLIAKARCSSFPDIPAMIYCAKDKGLKTKIEGGGPAGIVATPLIEGYLTYAIVGIRKPIKEYKLTKENVSATSELVILKDGTQVTQLTFIPKTGKTLEFTKIIMSVEPKKWLIIQLKITEKGKETSTECEYNKECLPVKIAMTGTGVGSMIKKTFPQDCLPLDMAMANVSGAEFTITNTYTTEGKFTVPAKTEITIEGKNIPKELGSTTITYSDFKVNVKIPDGIFAEPKKVKPGN
ncbi:MAG: hypothetical protein V1871_05770 [Planctomycetota bacterium]